MASKIAGLCFLLTLATSEAGLRFKRVPDPSPSGAPTDTDVTLPEYKLSSCPTTTERRCSASEDADLPTCISQFLNDAFIMADGNGCECQSRTDVNGNKMASNTTIEALISKAKSLFEADQCNGEVRGQSDDYGAGSSETSSQMLTSLYSATDYTDTSGKQYTLIVTNGIPDHCYLNGQYIANPNLAREHYRALFVPKIQPTKQSTLRDNEMGSVGIAISGAFFYNHRSAEDSCRAAGVTEKGSLPNFDPCDGHADAKGTYHYHKTPVCISNYSTCGLMGYMNDGFPVYGKCILTTTSASGQQSKIRLRSCYEKDSSKNGCDTTHFTLQDEGTEIDGYACNLDAANGFSFTEDMVGSNGQEFKSGTYAYFFTPEYPFIMPGLYGNRQKWCVLDKPWA